MILNVKCPRCGEQGVMIDKTQDLRAYLVSCKSCNARVQIPAHPILDYIVDAGGDTVRVLEKYRAVYEVIKMAFRATEEKDGDVR